SLIKPAGQRPGASAPGRASLLAIYCYDAVKKLQGLFAFSLERIASDDGAKAAAVVNGLGFLEDGVVRAGGAAGENNDAAPAKGALHHMFDTVGQRADVYFFFLVNLAGGFLLEFLGGQFDLDDVGAQLRRDVRRVAADVHGGFAVLAEGRAARIRPDDDD